jgi:hypothetical protein
MRYTFWPCVVVIAYALAACSEESTSEATGGSAGSSAGSAGSSGGDAGSAGDAGSSGGSAGDAGSSGGSAGATGRWAPAPGTSWQWQLSGAIDTSVEVAMYDVDLVEAPETVIDELRAAGRKVVCYFSAGSREDWRPDASAFQPSDYGNPLVGWPGENWLDIRSENVRTIMKARLDLAVSKHCDGVEPDNVDGYANDSGFPLSQSDQIDYDRFLAAEAHARGLSVGLKNSVELVVELEPDFDWALNEECLTYSECSSLAPFIAAAKAVFHVEYVDQESEGAAKLASTCGDASISGFSTLIKKWDLDAWRLACP